MDNWQRVVTAIKEWGTIVAALIAFIGYFVKYQNDLKIERRKNRLERVNRQLAEFYGPLYANASAGRAVWLAFHERYPDRHLTAEKGMAWRIWVGEVFMPINFRTATIVTEKSDLLEGDRMPECLLELVAHVAGYKAVMKKWESNEFADVESVFPFPQGVVEYAEAAFQRLKSEQASLLGSLRESTSR